MPIVNRKSAETEHRRKNPDDRTENSARLTAVAAEKALSKVWDTPEEDAAWAHL